MARTVIRLVNVTSLWIRDPFPWYIPFLSSPLNTILLGYPSVFKGSFETENPVRLRGEERKDSLTGKFRPAFEG